jgi:putative membrane protein
MTMKEIRIGVLCTVAVIAPSIVFAQMGSTPNQPSQSQSNQQQTNQPGATQDSGMAGAMTGTNGSDSQSMRDRMFLRKAAEGGMTEIQLSQLALQKSNSDDVKQFAQKMVDDHTTLNNNMKPIADSMGVRTPTKLDGKAQAEYDKLNGMSGDDFDKEYLSFMVKDHHKDVREFRTEDAAASDANLKSAVDQALQVIQQHTMMVDKLAKSKGVSMPGHAAPSGQ